ncbi:MAG: response regulator transcription factor [Acidimicrobiia bacterium]
MTEATILVVEDDEAIGRALVGTLEAQGFAAEWARDGASGTRLAGTVAPDLVLLDLGLPDVDGIDVCRGLRRANPTLPIVILTARRSEVDVVLGLDAGADDYITKPFRLAELLARVRAQLRRGERATLGGDQLRVGDVEVEVDARRVRVAGREIDLRAREFELLVFLMRHAGAAVTRERIMTEVWDEHWFGSTKTLDMHISALRRKFGEAIGDDATPSRITTLRGVGYRFEVP